MSKKKRKNKRKRNKRRSHTPDTPPVLGWQDEDGMHALIPGLSPSPDQVEQMTKQYQQNIRNSPLWDQMVEEFGPKEAEKLLKQCRIKIK